MNRSGFKKLENKRLKSNRSSAPEGKAERLALRETAREKEKTHRRICAWCGLLLQQGMEPPSHGICRDCTDFVFGEFQIAEDSLDPFCEVCSGLYDKQKCLRCRIDGSTGGMPIGKTIIAENGQ